MEELNIRMNNGENTFKGGSPKQEHNQQPGEQAGERTEKREQKHNVQEGRKVTPPPTREQRDIREATHKANDIRQEFSALADVRRMTDAAGIVSILPKRPPS